jgi:hypothetical protein
MNEPRTHTDAHGIKKIRPTVIILKKIGVEIGIGIAIGIESPKPKWPKHSLFDTSLVPE